MPNRNIWGMLSGRKTGRIHTLEDPRTGQKKVLPVNLGKMLTCGLPSPSREKSGIIEYHKCVPAIVIEDQNFDFC